MEDFDSYVFMFRGSIFNKPKIFIDNFLDLVVDLIYYSTSSSSVGVANSFVIKNLGKNVTNLFLFQDRSELKRVSNKLA